MFNDEYEDEDFMNEEIESDGFEEVAPPKKAAVVPKKAAVVPEKKPTVVKPAFVIPADSDEEQSDGDDFEVCPVT
jgi:hypothetical protein